MSEIDRNEIVLIFDHSNFKRNTADTVKTLDALQDKINGSGNGLGKAAKGFDVSGITDSINLVGKRFKLMGIVGMSVVNKLTNHTIDAGIRIAKGLPQMVIQGGWKRAMNMEKAKFLIDGLSEKLGVAWDETSKTFKEGMKTIKEAVDESVKGTAYALDEASLVASQFLSSGITDVEKLEHSLKSVSGLASVLSADYGDIGRIFAQVAGQGRMMGDDLLQLSQRGIGAAAEIQNYLNENRKLADEAMQSAIDNGRMVKSMKEIQTHSKLTEADVREMVRAGAISFQIMSDSFEHFFEQAQKANDTYSGSLSNLKSALNRFGETFEDKKLKNLTRMFNALIPVVNRLKVVLEPLTTAIGNMSTKVTDIAVKAIGSFAEAIGVDFSDPKVNGFFRFANGLERFEKGVEKTNNKLNKSNDKAAHKFMITAKEWQAAQDVWYKGSYGTGQRRADEIRELGMSYENVQGVINEFYRVGFKWEAIDKEIIDSTKDRTKANEEAAKSNEEVAFTYPPLVTALKTLGSVLKAAQTGFKGVKNIGQVVAKLFKTGLGEAIRGSAVYLMHFSERIINLANRFKAFSKEFKIEAFSKIDQVIGPAIFNLFQKIGTSIEWLHDKISTGWERLKEFFELFSKTEGFESLKESVSTLVEKIKEMSGSGLGQVVEWFRELSGMMFDNASMDNVVKFFSGIANSLSGIINKLSSGENPFSGFFDNLDRFKHWMSFKVQVKDSIGSKFSDAVNYPALASSINNFKKLDVGGRTLKAADGLTEFVNRLSKGLNTKNVQGYSNEVLKKLEEGDWDKISKIALRIVSIGAIIKSTKDLSEMVSAFTGIGKSISGFFRSLGGIADSISKSIRIEAFRTIAISIALLAASIVALAAVPTERLLPAAGVILTFMGIMSGIMKMTTLPSFDPRRMTDVGLAFAGMGAGMLLISMAVAKLGKLNPGQLIQGGIAVVAFMGAFAFIATKAKALSGIGTTFIGLAVAVTSLVFAVELFGHMKPETFAKGMGFVLIGMLSLSLAARIAGKDSKTCASFFAIAAALYALIPAIILMALIPTTRAIQGAACIAGVMVALGAAARLAGKSEAGLKTMAAMGSTIAILTVSLTVLSFLDPSALASAVASLMSVIITLALSSNVMSKAKAGAGMMMAVIAVLTGAIVLLIKLDPKAAIGIALSLGVFASAMGVACALLAAVNPIGALSAVGSLAIFVAGIIAIVELVGKIQSEGHIDRINKAKKMFTALGDAFGGFASGFLLSSSSTLPQVADNLKQFTDVFVPMLHELNSVDTESIGALKDLAQALALITGGGVMDKLGSAFGAGSKASMSGFGDSLDSIAEKFVPFVKKVGSGGFDSESLENVKKLGEALGTFAGVAGQLPKEDGWWQKLSGSTQGIDQFAEDIKDVPKTIKDIGEDASSFTDDDLTNVARVKDALVMMVDVANSLPKGTTFMTGGLVQTFTGSSNLGLFAEQLADFVPGFKTFSDACGKSTDESTFGRLDRVKNVAAAVAAMAEAQDAIPKGSTFMTGGLKQLGTGYSNLKTFSEQLADFVPGFKTFSDACGAAGGDETFGNLSRVKNVAASVAAMAEANALIPPNEGGIHLLEGKADLVTFANDLTDFVPPFQKFSKAVSSSGEEFNDTNLEKISKIGTALTALAKLSTELTAADEGGGKWFKFGSDEEGSELEAFSSGLSKMVGSLGTFAKDSKDIDPGELDEAATKVSTVTTMLKSFSEVGGETGKIPDGKELVTFAQNMKAFNATMTGVEIDDSKFENLAGYLKTFGEKMEGIDSNDLSGKADMISKVANAVKVFKAIGDIPSGRNLPVLSDNVKTFTNNMIEMSVKGLESKASSVATAVGKLKSAAEKAAGQKGSGSSMTSAGSAIGDSYIKGIESKKDAASSAGAKLAAKAKKGATDADGPGSFKRIGENMGSALAKGLSNKYDAVKQQAERLINKAKEAANAAAEINSPSKVFMRIGSGLGEGLVLGMNRYEDEVYNASYSMASASVEAANYALMGVDEFASPTITPVIDLSEVRKGARTINSLVSSSKAIAVNANVSSSPSRYSTAGMLSKLVDKMNDTEQSITVKVANDKLGNTMVNNITVDGATDPEAFANQLIDSFKMRMRTG